MYIDKKIIKIQSDLLFDIEKDRFYYMGLAMIFVILYHMLCSHIIIPGLKLFKYGYIGVDIFFFFSAFGCCFSLEKNTLNGFYRRRLVRIMPLFVFDALFDSCYSQYFRNVDLGFWDWICNLTSLSFYGFGGIKRDWYLSSLILIYILFPIIYKCVRKTNYLLGGGNNYSGFLLFEFKYPLDV